MSMKVEKGLLNIPTPKRQGSKLIIQLKGVPKNNSSNADESPFGKEGSD